MTVSALAGGEAAMAAPASSAANAVLRDRIMIDSSSLLGLCAIVAGDFKPRRLPHPRMPADIGERGLEGVDAMRHAGEIGVKRHSDGPADHLSEQPQRRELVGGRL